MTRNVTFEWFLAGLRPFIGFHCFCFHCQDFGWFLLNPHSKIRGSGLLVEPSLTFAAPQTYASDFLGGLLLNTKNSLLLCCLNVFTRRCWWVFSVKVSRDDRLWEQESQLSPRRHSLRIIRSLDGVRPESNVLFRLALFGWRHTGTINWDLVSAGLRAESGPGKALNTVMNIRLRFQRYKSSESELQQGWPLIG